MEKVKALQAIRHQKIIKHRQSLFGNPPVDTKNILILFQRETVFKLRFMLRLWSGLASRKTTITQIFEHT